MPLGASETIGTIGHVQSQGALLGYRADSEMLFAVSQTLPEFTALRDAAEALGRPIEEILGRIACHDLRNSCSLSFIKERREHISTVDIGHGPVGMSAFQSGNSVWVEIEPDEPENPSAILLKDMARLRDRIVNARDVSELLGETVGLLRTLAGFDRIQAIRLAGDEGSVVAEAKRMSLGATLGSNPGVPQGLPRLHPNIVLDIEAAPSALLSFEDLSPDLTLAALSVPTVDVADALRRHGMTASVTHPLIVDRKPWGLLWFQHRRPRRMPLRARQAVEATLPLINATLENRL